MTRRWNPLKQTTAGLLAMLIAAPASAANIAAAAKVKIAPVNGGLGAVGRAGASSLALPAATSLSGTLSAPTALPTAAAPSALAAPSAQAAHVQAAAPQAEAAAAPSAQPSSIAAPQAAAEETGPATLASLLKNPQAVTASAADIGKLSGGGAAHAGRQMFERILGVKTRDGAASVAGVIESRDVRPLAGLKPAGSLNAWSGDKKAHIPAEGVDPDSNDALRAVGLDERLLPIVEVLGSRAGKGGELAHLSWALKELIKDGGVVRYAYTYNPETNEPIPGMYNASEKTLYINDMIRRADPLLQGAIFAGLLQQAYDHLTARAPATQEALVREIRVKEKFLADLDMVEMARRIDIGNAVTVELFEQIVQTRLYAASGMSTLQRLYGQNAEVGQLSDSGAKEAELLKRELGDLEDQLGLFEKARRDAPDSAEYARALRVLREKISIKRGKIAAADRRAEMLGEEAARRDGETIVTPLAVDRGHWAKLKDGDLKVVKVRQKPAVDPALDATLEMIRETITKSDDPEIRGLGYVLTTIDKLLDAGGSIVFAPPGDGAAAYFSPVTLDLVIGREFAKTHPALIASLMVHELTHAADYFGVPQDDGDWLQRPLTRETERNAFTNEAIFAGAFNAEEIGAALDVRNPMEQKIYDLVFHARLRWVEGKTSLEAMISDAYRDLFGAHFSGLQTAAQVKHEIQVSKLAKILEQYEDLKLRADLTAQAVAAGESGRQAQLDNMNLALHFYEAYLTVYQRQIQQMELEDIQVPQAPEASAPVEGGTAGLPSISSWRHPSAG